MQENKTGLYLSLVLAMLFWGLTFVFYKFAYESFRPITVIFFRLIISVAFLYISSKVLKKLQVVNRKDLLYLLLLSFFEPFLYFIGEGYGLTYISSTLASVIVATIPLFVPVAAFIFYRERLNFMNKTGLVVSFIGVLAVVFSSDVDLSATFKGVLLMFLAVGSAVAYAILIKKLSSKYNGFTITIWQNIFGLFLFAPLFFIVDLKHVIAIEPSLNAILALLYLAIFGSSITFILFARGVRELGASRANIFANLIPVFTAITAFILLNESMPAIKVIGIVLVLAGLVMSQVKKVKLRKDTLPPTIQYPG